MEKEFSSIVRNSLFAMVDMFLDYAMHEDLDTQKGNLSEFVIDCINVKQEEPEYKLIVAKFTEEFVHDGRYDLLDKEEVIRILKDAIQRLISNMDDIPSIIVDAIDQYYE